MRTRTPEELAKVINDSSVWDYEACRDLCDWADMLEEWDEADGDEFEGVVYEAAKRLGVALD